jgi:formate hydrogenlyase subunit 6/NADH:ubiquinone oxidoreductase subunit I
MAYIIYKDKCISCGVCKPLCPAQAIEEHDGAYKIDVTKCIDCGICEPVCPVEAIFQI